jgi:signal peptidase I
MDFDFPLILVILTFVTGIIYLADVLLWAPKRVQTNEPANPLDEATKEAEKPWVIETSRSFFPVLAIVLVLRSFLIEPFQIPSGSMLPTLEVGDFILVNKFEYGIRLPVIGTKVIELGDPQRGDIMVFKYPEDGKTNYIKRVVGVPGDLIKYENKQLTVNGELVSEKLIANLHKEQLFEEQLGPVSHQIYKTKRYPNLGAEGLWKIPDGHYFMMGDNRDNSNDSRFWGLVPDEMVVGKAFAIWMHWPSLGTLPSFSRVGGIQ